MTWNLLQRTWLQAVIAAGGATSRPIEADGLVMDRTMSAFVRLVRRLRKQGAPDLATMRRQYEAGPGVTGLRPARSVRVEGLKVAGRGARRYAPPENARAKLLYFHGGGFIMGGLDTHDPLCRMLAERAGMEVVAIDYRLAPEHPFPAGYDDAVAAWAWAQRSGGTWLVGGDSAGANLAAGQALDGSAALQLLIYPVVDVLSQDDGQYRSLSLFGRGYVLEEDMMADCTRLLLPPGQDPADVRLSPIRGDLSRASPALVITAGFDPLRDQGRAYVAALKENGVEAHLVEERGMVHGFADFGGVVPEARRAVERIADAVADALKRRGM